MPQDLEKAYDPTAIEDRWAAYWVSERLFELPSAERAPDHPPFTMLLPPPNVTGSLHMGHMFEHTETDILVRWRRMCGDLTLWLPGTDHAGIATQMLVERQLKSEGQTRQELGRDAFTERVWQWKQHYGGMIMQQMKRLGASVDWSREYFTMDEDLSLAVREAFVRLYEQGLIYRGAYIVNWDPVQQTAVSDLEVTHEDRPGKLYYVRYPLADGSGSIVIATTRPETMLADAAVAVNPEDARYLALRGKLLRLPLSAVNGQPDREIPVIADAWANPEFGTGAVKVTPAHDPNDFAIGQRHGLPQLNIMDETARIHLPGSPYHGLDRYAARERIVEDLRALDLLVDVQDHKMAVGVSQRTGAVIEPRLSTQWFVKIQPLADKAIAAVEQGHIQFTPEHYTKTYYEWMRNIYDWCISRQLWWGHRIPAWHCAACKQITVARNAPSRCAHCSSSEITQETDVLDTWFSSGLLPCSVFGWPQHSRDLDIFYPTQLLITGFDILFFWVARMIMLGCHFMLDMPMANGAQRTLKDAVPFRQVYIHGLIRDAERQKMSKTKGNVIDPIGIVGKFGTDAVRFTLAAMASPGVDIAFSEARTEGYRAFANKIWNAARFIFMNVERAKEAVISVLPKHEKIAIPHGAANLDEGIISHLSLQAMPYVGADAPLEARWITLQLHNAAKFVGDALNSYRFDEAAHHIYQFFWGDFCDWYLEIVKLRLVFEKGADKHAAKAALGTLLAVFEAALRLLSPFMPFITEELWHALYNGKPPARSIALSWYPRSDGRVVGTLMPSETEMMALQTLIVSGRAARKELGVEERAAVPVRIRANAAARSTFEQNAQIIERLARVSSLEFIDSPLEGSGIRSTPAFDVQVVYERVLDAAAERERLKKELAQFAKEQINAERQLSNESFLAKAPSHVVEGIRRRAAELVLLIEKARRALERLGS